MYITKQRENFREQLRFSVKNLWYDDEKLEAKYLKEEKIGLVFWQFRWKRFIEIIMKRKITSKRRKKKSIISSNSNEVSVYGEILRDYDQSVL